MGTDYNRIYIDGVQQSPAYVHGSASIGNAFLNVPNADFVGIGARKTQGALNSYAESDFDEISIWNSLGAGTAP